MGADPLSRSSAPPSASPPSRREHGWLPFTARGLCGRMRERREGGLRARRPLESKRPTPAATIMNPPLKGGCPRRLFQLPQQRRIPVLGARSGLPRKTCRFTQLEPRGAGTPIIAEHAGCRTMPPGGGPEPWRKANAPATASCHDGRALDSALCRPDRPGGWPR